MPLARRRLDSPKIYAAANLGGLGPPKLAGLSIKVILQGLFEELAGPLQQAVHGLGAEPQLRADLLIGEPGEALQDQGPALVLRQAVEQFLQLAVQVVFFQDFQGTGPGVRRVGSFLLVQRFLGTPPAQQIQAMVGGDAVQPGGDAGLGLEAVGVFIDLEEDLLGRVFGFQGVAQQPVGDLIDPLLVAADQLRQGGVLAPGQTPEQGVIEVGGFGAQNGIRKMPSSFLQARSNSRWRSTANSRCSSSSLIPRTRAASCLDTSPFSLTRSWSCCCLRGESKATRADP